MNSLQFDKSKLIRLTDRRTEIGAAVIGRKIGTKEWFFGYVGESDPRRYGYRFEKLRENEPGWSDWTGDDSWEKSRLIYLSVIFPERQVIRLFGDAFKEYELYEPPGRPDAPGRVFHHRKGPVSFEVRFPPLAFPNGSVHWESHNKQLKRQLAEEMKDERS